MINCLTPCKNCKKLILLACILFPFYFESPSLYIIHSRYGNPWLLSIGHQQIDGCGLTSMDSAPAFGTPSAEKLAELFQALFDGLRSHANNSSIEWLFVSCFAVKQRNLVGKTCQDSFMNLCAPGLSIDLSRRQQNGLSLPDTRRVFAPAPLPYALPGDRLPGFPNVYDSRGTGAPGADLR